MVSFCSQFCYFLTLLFFFSVSVSSFFFNDTATTEIYTLSLHDALPICSPVVRRCSRRGISLHDYYRECSRRTSDRKSTRLNSSHRCISYAVFCLKKKKKNKHIIKKNNKR